MKKEAATSNSIKANLVRNQTAYACADSNGCIAEETAPSGQTLLARQTGQLLISLGQKLARK